jgi:butyryl-CoA dehydrogenase
VFYNAAKFAVRGFADALRMELEIDRSGVSYTTVHPGGVKTNIARNARIDPEVAAQAGGPADPRRLFDRVARTAPESAARQILSAVERDRRRALIGPDALVIDLLARLPVGVYQRMLVTGARRTLGGGRRSV